MELTTNNYALLATKCAFDLWNAPHGPTVVWTVMCGCDFSYMRYHQSVSSLFLPTMKDFICKKKQALSSFGMCIRAVKTAKCVPMLMVTMNCPI